jgi:hypothetical protein
MNPLPVILAEVGVGHFNFLHCSPVFLPVPDDTASNSGPHL